MNVKFQAALLAGCFALSACADPGKQGPCPTSGTLSDAATMTVFRPGGGRDATDIEYVVRITDVALSCRYGKDTVTAKALVTVQAERGPAASSSALTVPYFVGVARGGETILAKEVFASRFELGAGGPRVRRERVRNIRIPLAPNTTGAAYQVIFGLQLTPEQLAYNRRDRAPTLP